LFVHWAADTQARFVANVGVNHCRGDVFVAQQFLDGPDIVSILEQVGGEAVPKGMAARGLCNASRADGVFDCVLQIFLADVVPPFLAAPRVDGDFLGGKDVLPA
jgi:hypothetical protein